MSELVFAAKVLANDRVSGDLYLLRLRTDSDLSAAGAGAFLHLKVDSGPYPLFRRAYSLLSATDSEVEILYKVTGTGTRLLCRHRAGDTISVMGPLGNSFTPPAATELAVFVAGGVGLPPVLRWAQQLRSKGLAEERSLFLYGARKQAELVLRERVEQLQIPTEYATDDGSFGFNGRITDLLLKAARSARQNHTQLRYYACGPEPMLAACARITGSEGVPGELALETPMPCGSGVCLGCIVPCRVDGKKTPEYRRTCVDGPVFDAGEVLWE
jgi:dihydroorotate dehydrogenase electron transfer subunit